MKLRKELRPEDVTAICDSREQCPLNLTPLKVRVCGLDTGDYSISGLEHVVTVERKSLDDFLACVGRERERFEREIQRILSFPIRAMVIESSITEIEKGEYRSQVTPAAAIGSILSWQAKGINVLFCNDHETAGRMTAKFLFSAARARWRESYAFVESILSSNDT